MHLIVPAIISAVFFRKKWWFAYLIMMSGMLIDIDHLLANPVYDAGRCSIGFHPLHGFVPIAVYTGLCLLPKTRLLGIGLVIHIVLDALDCQMTNGVWFV